jgi:hypothetical protein
MARLAFLAAAAAVLELQAQVPLLDLGPRHILVAAVVVLGLIGLMAVSKPPVQAGEWF